jgi:hypothetical protein
MEYAIKSVPVKSVSMMMETVSLKVMWNVPQAVRGLIEMIATVMRSVIM